MRISFLPSFLYIQWYRLLCPERLAIDEEHFRANARRRLAFRAGTVAADKLDSDGIANLESPTSSLGTPAASVTASGAPLEEQGLLKLDLENLDLQVNYC